MATITEDYCSREVYKLLIEKGFDGEIHTTFDGEGYTQPSITLQTAMKWLSEEHSLFICIEIGVGAYVWSIADISNGNVILKLDAVIGSYEDTVEAAIKYCLENLI